MTLREARLACGKTQGEMARELFMGLIKYKWIERYPKRITVTEAIMITKVTGINLDDLEF